MFKTHLGILKNLKYADTALRVINLNSPTVDLAFLKVLGASKATVILCDGAYHRTLDHFDHTNKEVHLIGDFDSIGKEVHSKVPKHITTHWVQDQDTGDLEKALLLSERLGGSTDNQLLVINGCSGSRFDHVM